MAYQIGNVYTAGDNVPDEIKNVVNNFKLGAYEIIPVAGSGTYYYEQKNLELTPIPSVLNPSYQVSAVFDTDTLPSPLIGFNGLALRFGTGIKHWLKNHKGELTTSNQSFTYYYTNDVANTPNIVLRLYNVRIQTTQEVTYARANFEFGFAQKTNALALSDFFHSGTVTEIASIEYTFRELVYDKNICVSYSDTLYTTFSDSYYLGLAIPYEDAGQLTYDYSYSVNTSGRVTFYNFNPWLFAQTNASGVTIKPIAENIPVTKIQTGGGAGGDVSEPGGGGGTFDNSSDPISVPNFTTNPIAGVESTGMIGIYAPTAAELKEFANWLWSDTVVDFLKDLFHINNGNLLDWVVKLALIPAEIPVSGPSSFTYGNLAVTSTITMNKAKSQFMTVDMGSIEVKEYWGNALDYAPNTSVQIFLPFIGFQTLMTDDVMGKTLHLQYNIDLVTGTCVAIISTVETDGVTKTLYQFNGNCEMQIPLTGASFQVDFGALVGAFTKPAAGQLLSQAGAGPFNYQVTRSGNLSGNIGFGSTLTPYIVINRHEQSLAANYNKLNGYPSNITAKLSTLSGFTKVSKIHLEGIPATESEISEIYNLLTEGVIL